MLPSTNMANLTKRDLKILTKGQLTALLMKNEFKNEAKTSQKPIPPPRVGKWAIQKPIAKPRTNVKGLVNQFEDLILPPLVQFRSPIVEQPELIELPVEFRDPIIKQPTKPSSNVKQQIESYEDLIIKPPKGFRDRHPKPQRPPPLVPTDKAPWKPTTVPFNCDDELFQTGNESLGKFKIVSTRSTQNKKFKSYTKEFRIKILKKLENTNEVYRIFQELIRTTKRRRKLSNNDRLRFIIQNEELPNAISTKFNKVKDLVLGDLENVIKILEYRDIPLENCRVVVQSIKIPAGTGRLYLTEDTVSRKNCIITVMIPYA